MFTDGTGGSGEQGLGGVPREVSPRQRPEKGSANVNSHEILLESEKIRLVASSYILVPMTKKSVK